MAGMGPRWREESYEVIEVSRGQILKEALGRTLHFVQRVFKRSEFSKLSLSFVWLVDKTGRDTWGDQLGGSCNSDKLLRWLWWK